MHFEFFEGEDGQWYWHIKSANNQIWVTSEGYTRRSTAEQAMFNFVLDFGSEEGSYAVYHRLPDGTRVNVAEEKRAK